MFLIRRYFIQLYFNMNINTNAWNNALTTYEYFYILSRKTSIKMAPHVFESNTGWDPLFFLYE